MHSPVHTTSSPSSTHRYPDLYARERLKYAERPHVMDHSVHPLGRRWADVLFFSPVHANLIFDALRESGRVSSQPAYWTIEADLLAPERTCICSSACAP